MAFLRSGKFFRFLSVGKNLVNFREYEAAHQLAPLCVCSSNNFATITAAASSQSLENSLKRLDQDVRRSGRISRRDLEEILDEIRTNKSATSSQSLLVIRCCGSLVPEEMPEIRTKMVQEIWKTLAKLNVPMDISHYNALLRVYLENEYSFSPTEFLEDLQSKGVEPNRVTYQRLISRYCQQGDIDGATRILEFMREKQLPVNENVFNALIMGHSYADDLESAVGILGVMSQAGLEPSADTYTTLLCGFARKGDIESINKFISQCEEKEVYLLDKDYLEVVYALAVNEHSEKIDEVLLKLKKAFGYNQDAVNVILRLINKGQEEVAMKILNTMPRSTNNSGETSDTGNFLIKQLIKSNRPVEQVLSICNELEESGMNSKPIMIAVEAALSTRNVALSKALLNEMLKKGMEVRQHYFWPILSAAKSEQEVFDICKMMQNDFQMPLNNQTIRDYVIPKILVDKDYNKVIEKLKNLGITLATAAATTAYVALNKFDIAKAAQIMESVEAYFSPGLFKRPLLFALSQTKDYDSHGKIIRQINDNMSRSRSLNQNLKQEEAEEEEDHEANVDSPAVSVRSIKTIQSEVVGDLVIDALVLFKTDRVEAVTNILSRLVDQGVSISSFKAEKIQERLGESLTAEISTMLGKLASGDLEPTPYERQRMQKTSGNSMDSESIERLIARLEGQGENTKGLKRALLVAAIKEKNFEKTEQIVERLKGEGYILSSGVYAQLIELYASGDKLEEALVIFKKMRETDPEFELDESKTIKIVHAYLNADRLDDAIKFLEENKLKEIPDEKAFMYQSTVWRLLNSLAEKSKTVEVNRLFDALVANKFIVPNNVLLGPLIKVYLVQDQLKEAVDKFEEICHKYRATPWKNEIACRLIQGEDAQSLQRVTDLSTEIHGEVNSLYDLVFSFIECGRVRQARKILETPGLKTRPGRINFACERYLNESMPTALEGLIEATKDLSHIDRSEIYYSLLQTYIKDVAPEKALGLWTAMQEEDITPSDVFLSKLAAFLKAQGHEVPFHVPAVSEAVPVETKVERTQNSQAPRKEPLKRREVEVTTTLGALRNAINGGNQDEISKAIQNLTPEDKVSHADRSRIIEAFVKIEKLPEATKMVFEMIAENAFPMPRIFRFYLNKIAISGDTETIEKIGNSLTSQTKKSISFDNRLCHAYVKAEKTDEYLQKLEDAIDGAQTEEQINKVVEEFPRGGAVGIMERKPELAERFEKIAIKYADKKALGPINVLWMHYLVNHDPKADEIFQKYLVDSPRLMFQRVIQMGRENQDEKLVQKLIDLLHGAKVSEGAVGNAYSCLLDIYATKANADGCLKTVDACVKDVCFENVNRTALVRAKECIEKSGLKFPHTIPEKKAANNQDSSSSSSSL